MPVPCGLPKLRLRFAQHFRRYFGLPGARMTTCRNAAFKYVQASPEGCRSRLGHLSTLQEVTLEYMEANGLLDFTLEVRYKRSTSWLCLSLRGVLLS